MGTHNPDKKLLKKFGANLKALRTSKSISQEQLGNIIGTSQKMIYLIEKGEVNTSISIAGSIAKALNVPLVSLFEF